MIDLHTHSTASDGTDSPTGLVDRAISLDLEALAITDHDTFAGADEALPYAAARGLRMVRGIEVSARLSSETAPERRTVHVLGYFFRDPAPAFREWLETLRAARRRRNAQMAERLQALGFDVTLEEAEALGSNITGRPHFAHILRQKGYIRTYEDAFRKFLGEKGSAYVEREDPEPVEAIRRIVEAGGIASLAHARRLNQTDATREQQIISSFVEAGLGAIEVWHSDHDEPARNRYRQFAERFRLAMTGGSDFHGAHKPDILLGRGRHTKHRVPLSVFEELAARG